MDRAELLRWVSNLSPEDIAANDFAPFTMSMFQEHFNRVGDSGAERERKAEWERVRKEMTSQAWVSSDAARKLLRGEVGGNEDLAVFGELLVSFAPLSAARSHSEMGKCPLIATSNAPAYEEELIQLVADGQDFKAYPLLANLAYLTFMQWGPDTPTPCGLCTGTQRMRSSEAR